MKYCLCQTLGNSCRRLFPLRFPQSRNRLGAMAFLWFWDAYENRLTCLDRETSYYPAASGAPIYLLSSFISFLAFSFICACPQGAETHARVLWIPCFPSQMPHGQQRLRNPSHQHSVADSGGSQHVTKSPSHFPWAGKDSWALWGTPMPSSGFTDWLCESKPHKVLWNSHL